MFPEIYKKLPSTRNYIEFQIATFLSAQKLPLEQVVMQGRTDVAQNVLLPLYNFNKPYN